MNGQRWESGHLREAERQLQIDYGEVLLLIGVRDNVKISADRLVREVENGDPPTSILPILSDSAVAYGLCEISADIHVMMNTGGIQLTMRDPLVAT